MLLRYTTPNGRIVIEQEIGKGKDAFEFLSKVQDLFEEETCGCCHGTRITCDVREYDGYKYYKYRCLNAECGAQLEFGQHKEGGGLFAKRWDKEAGRALPDNGWFVWKGEADRDHADQAPAPQQQGQRPYKSMQPAPARKEEIPW